jgi:hypothetical protein
VPAGLGLVHFDGGARRSQHFAQAGQALVLAPSRRVGLAQVLDAIEQRTRVG